MFTSSLSAAEEYISSPNLELELKIELEPLINAAKNGDHSAISEINTRFMHPLSFGTGGLRSFMTAGLSRINKPNIRRVTLALAAVAKKHAQNSKCAHIALVGFDSRLQSDIFAFETARIFAESGFLVYLGSKPLPTPFLCYAMRQLKTICGVIITASHNPKEYNGYKAYDNLGGQIIEPWDKEIEEVMSTLPLVPKMTSNLYDKNILSIPKEIEEGYIQLGLKLRQLPDVYTKTNILYTPLYGTGIAFVPELYRRAGLNLDICYTQSIFDGTFPTAPKPNPEELTAYSATIIEADKKKDTEFIIANDPDADRIGLLAKQDNVWKLIPGNDLIALVLEYLCSHKKLNGIVITTVVTSDFVAKVAQYYGLEVMWTLTGFKYICASMNELEKNFEHFAFGAEESLGMQFSNSIRDKDGVIAALIIGEMIGYYKALGVSLFEAITNLKKKVGFFCYRLVNIENHSHNGIEVFATAMSNIRNSNITKFAGELITTKEDYKVGKIYHNLNGKIETIIDRPNNATYAKPIKHSNVLKLRLESGAFAAFRPSGTEPKLKIYLQSCNTNINFLDEMEEYTHKILNL